MNKEEKVAMQNRFDDIKNALRLGDNRTAWSLLIKTRRDGMEKAARLTCRGCLEDGDPTSEIVNRTTAKLYHSGSEMFCVAAAILEEL